MVSRCATTTLRGGVPVRALGTRARCVPVMTRTGGHSWSLAVTRNATAPGVDAATCTGRRGDRKLGNRWTGDREQRRTRRDRLVAIPRDERILVAARQRFERAGFRHTSVADIAADAGVATGTVYWHFTSKERLFLHLIEADNAAWVERADAASGGPGSALERLGALAEASTEHFQSSALLLAVLRRDRQMIPAPMIEDLHHEPRTEASRSSPGFSEQGWRRGRSEWSTRSPPRPVFAAGHALFNQTDHSYAELSQCSPTSWCAGCAAMTCNQPVCRSEPGA